MRAYVRVLGQAAVLKHGPTNWDAISRDREFLQLISCHTSEDLQARAQVSVMRKTKSQRGRALFRRSGGVSNSRGAGQRRVDLALPTTASEPRRFQRRAHRLPGCRCLHCCCAWAGEEGALLSKKDRKLCGQRKSAVRRQRAHNSLKRLRAQQLKTGCDRVCVCVCACVCVRARA